MRNRVPRIMALFLLWISLPCVSCSKKDSNKSNEPACTMPDVPDVVPDPNAKKFALTMFHYNLEYVVGGLEAVDGFDSFCGSPCDGWDNDKVEDWIIEETFAPVLHFYMQHPKWKVNFEMQAYMLKVMAQRFPKVLDDLRDAVASGIVELTSFHYADQLFLAYPKEDMEKSQELTQKIFKDNCVPLSGVVFNQEGQAGEGRQQFLAEHGYNIGVFPKNLFKYFRQGEKFWPYYKTRFGAYMIIGPGDLDPDSGIQVSWPFFNDGELLATGNLPPYMAPVASYKPKYLDEYAKKLQDLEDQGYKIATISEYVESLKAQGIELKDAPPLLDGTWQPPSTDSIHRWLGGMGDAPYSPAQEQDNMVRAGNARAGIALKAAQALYRHVKATKGGDPAIEKKIEDDWISLLRAEVSDASGVNPWAGEVRWSLDLNKAIQEDAGQIIDDLKSRISAKVVAIDLGSGQVAVLDEIPGENLEETEEPITGFMVSGPGRDIQTTWYKLSDSRYRVKLDFSKVTGGEDRKITVTFPWTGTKIVYSPGLMDDQVVEYNISDFSFSKDEVFLPLSNGLIGLGGGWFVIKHVRYNHIAARVPASGENIQFIDETQPPDQAVTWKFELVKGTKEQALEVARSINITPTVYY
ncbi:MAG: hypothetical protein GXP49_17610 [Deltaproteobacteria bacterium]|nr:hypothetical protein [Deltaproteobacteria bacterium]